MSPAPEGRLRAAGFAGICAAVLLFGGFALLLTPPTPDSPPARIADYLIDYRSRVFVATCLLGLGSVLFVWLLAALRTFLAAHGETTLSTAAALGGLAGTTLILAAFAVLAGVVLHLDRGPSTVALGFDVFNAFVTLAGFGFALAVAGSAWSSASTGALPGLYGIGGLFIAALQLATIPGLFAQSGFFAAGGAMALIAFGALGAWYVAVSIRFIRG